MEKSGRKSFVQRSNSNNQNMICPFADRHLLLLELSSTTITGVQFAAWNKIEGSSSNAERQTNDA